MKAHSLLRITIVAGICLTALAGVAQEQDRAPAEDEAEQIFARSCATCHSTIQSGRTPSRFSLGQLTPRAIVATLEDGAMRAEGALLTHAQRVAVAEFLSGRTYAADAMPAAAYCADRGFAPLDTSAVSWMGYGGNLEGTGFQPADRAGLTAAEVPDLELRWAFAL